MTLEIEITRSVKCSTPGCAYLGSEYRFFICKACSLTKIDDLEKLKTCSISELSNHAICGNCSLKNHIRKNHGSVEDYYEYLHLRTHAAKSTCSLPNSESNNRRKTESADEKVTVEEKTNNEHDFDIITHEDCISA